MAEELRVVITAKDGASRVFKEVGAAAGDVGKKAEEAGEKGERGFKRVGDSAKKASIDSQALSAALTAVGAALSYSGAMAMQQERQMIALNRAFGENADEVIRFAEELDDLTIFSDDDIRAGQRFFATLQNNYDLSIDQIKELMVITSELAASSGVSFEDASSRVTAAIRGEGEAAEYLGLTMNQQSIDRENLTLTMSNQEAAQFRLNALLEQSAPYMGANNDLMETSVGTIAEWNDKMQDIGASVGGFLGPVATLTTGVGTLGIGITGLATGFGAFSAVAGRAATTLRGSTVAMRAFSLALGPVGIGIAAISLVGAGLWQSFQEGKQATEDLNASMSTLDTTIESLRRRGETGLADLAEEIKAEIAAFDSVEIGLPEMTDAQVINLAASVSGGIEMGADDARAFLEKWNPDVTIALKLDDQDLTKIYDKIDEALNDPNVDSAAFIEWADGLLEAAAATSTLTDDYEALTTILERPLSDFPIISSGAESTTGVAAAFGLLNTEVDSFIEKLMKINDIEEDDPFLEKFLKTLGTNASDRAGILNFIEELAGGFTELSEMPGPGAEQDEWIEWVNAEGISQTERNRRTKIANETRREEAVAIRETTLALAANENAVNGVTNALDSLEQAQRDAWAGIGADVVDIATQSIEDYNEHLEEMKELIGGILELTGNDDFLSQWNMTSAASEASLLAGNLQDVSAQLDTIFRIVVGNTNAIGSQMQGIKDWSDDLIGDPGVWAEIDALYNEGRISLEKYNEAQQAQVEITEANATIQRDILAIQAAQAPMIAQNTSNLADYVEEIRQMNDGYDDAEDGALRQTEALGWLDQQTANSAMNIAMFADQLDDLGPGGEDAFRQLEDGAVAVNPALLPMLETMGYIENLRQNSDGTWEYDVSINGADAAMSEIEMLTTAIVNLIDMMDDDELNGSFSINAEDNATMTMESIQEQRDGLDGSNADATVTTVDNASSTLDYISDQLGLLDGRTAITYIRTMYEQYGTVPGYVGPTMANGGVVGEYADGGVVIRAAEVGPEILHYANGGTAVMPYDGLYSVPVGSYISPAHASASQIGGAGVTIDFSGAVFHNTSRAEMNAWAREDFVPMIERSIEDRRTGTGGA